MLQASQVEELITVGVSALAYQWLKEVTELGRYDQADGFDNCQTSSIWDIENLNTADDSQIEEFWTLLYANSELTKEDVQGTRYFDIYIDPLL